MPNLIRNIIHPLTLTLTISALALSACEDDQIFNQSAAELSESVITPAELGMGDDWTEVEPGIWTRVDTDGEEHSLGIGEAGRLHSIASLESVEADLKAMLAIEDREETRLEIEEIDALITDLRVSEASTTPEGSFRCSPSLSASAEAKPSQCGATAKAFAYYSGCNWGTVRTYAQAACGYESKSHSCGPKTGNPVSCSSMVSITGPNPCSSYGWAQINAPGVYVFVEQKNYQRGTCPGDNNSGGLGMCGPCTIGKDCHCGDVCRTIGISCP
jgi:hypothetical protein